MSSHEEPVEVRLMVPRSKLLASPPDFYTQLNCEGMLGLPRRKFLEMLRRSDAPPVVREGKIRMVQRAAMLDYLDRLRREQDAAGVEDLDGPDKVLLEMGCAPLHR